MPLDGPSFAAAVTSLIGRSLAPDERFAVAVSGGADSLALLLLATDAYGARVQALTVDHGLRPAAAAEAAQVAAICAALGVPHAILRWEAEKPGASLQAEARAARYRLMADFCRDAGIAFLATAHHADDQAETLLLRLSRGAGLGGLAGVRACRPLAPGVTLLRPLLPQRRAALAALVAARGLTPVDDPSNRDPRYDRTHARALLQAAKWLDAERLAASAAHLADAEAALAWTAAFAWQGRASVTQDEVRLDAADLPHEVVRRLVLRAIAMIAPGATPRGPDVERLIAKLMAGRTATLAGVKARGGPVWRFIAEHKQG